MATIQDTFHQELRASSIFECPRMALSNANIFEFQVRGLAADGFPASFTAGLVDRIWQDDDIIVPRMRVHYTDVGLPPNLAIDTILMLNSGIEQDCYTPGVAVQWHIMGVSKGDRYGPWFILGVDACHPARNYYPLVAVIYPRQESARNPAWRFALLASSPY